MMLNENQKNISTKESFRFCLFSGIFLYALLSLPLILFKLFPPTPSKGLDITYGIFEAPKVYAFIVGFGLFAILGICLLKKLNLKKRLVYYSFLTLFLSIGGGFLTRILEITDYLDIDRIASIFSELKGNWFETALFEFHIHRWLILFTLILVPFSIIFFAIKSLITKLISRNKFV